MKATNYAPCECSKGQGHKVMIHWPNSPNSPETPCCSCTVEQFRMLYGEPTFSVVPVLMEETQ